MLALVPLALGLIHNGLQFLKTEDVLGAGFTAFGIAFLGLGIALLIWGAVLISRSWLSSVETLSGYDSESKCGTSSVATVQHLEAAQTPIKQCFSDDAHPKDGLLLRLGCLALAALMLFIGPGRETVKRHWRNLLIFLQLEERPPTVFPLEQSKQLPLETDADREARELYQKVFNR